MRLVCGAGVNDSPVKVTWNLEGKQYTCPHYRLWRDMVTRCYSGRQPAYANVKVCQSWLTFSSFLEWSQLNRVEGWQLDKDFLGDGSLYSPATCAFIPTYLNNTFDNSTASNGLALGVCMSGSKFYPQITLSGKVKALGRYNSEWLAHKAWLIEKSEQLTKLLDRYRLEQYASQDIIHSLEVKRSKLVSAIVHETLIHSIKDL